MRLDENRAGEFDDEGSARSDAAKDARESDYPVAVLKVIAVYRRTVGVAADPE